MSEVAIGIRERVAAGGARIARVKRADRLATAVITLGGLLIIVGVSFIFLFILGETWPLFRSAQGRSLGVLPLALPSPSAGAAPARPLAFGTDEYQMYLYELLDDGRLLFYRTKHGRLARELQAPSLVGARITTASRSLKNDFVAAGTADGRLALLQVRFRPRYEQAALVDLDIELRERAVLQLDPAARALRAVTYEEHDGRKAAAALLADGSLGAVQIADDETQTRVDLRVEAGEQVTQLILARTEGLVAATDQGLLYFWELVPEVRLASRSPAARAPITALATNFGGLSILVGDQGGNVSSWFRARLKDDDAEMALVEARRFPAQGAPITAIAASTRDKSFVTSGADGSVWLRHTTSGATLLQFPATGQRPERLMLTPKMDGILAGQQDGRLKRYEIQSPHPEFSWAALFGKVWYEGYAQPEYVWQSTGGTDDFEPKFSLVPLIFGTIKGTVYALLFAVPIAIFGALYTSQFMHPSLKAKVKPVVEIMAALPSVVIGFVAGLWLASRVETRIVPVMLMVVLLPFFGTLGVLFWERLPRGLAGRLRPGMAIFVILPLLVLGAGAAIWLGPGLEGGFFGADFKLWLSQALGLVYDQRNCVVVGIAMGFAVIPIIFTISEDAFSSVPAHLSAASLALGASRWQTATRVVLPTASPGLFSAVMIGFGRAVGETMIVLMATGNTPVMDWSVFNGMRTLSANIAVEIPEAPHGGSLYRILFLAAGVLFAMTFAVNTVAELVRQRLRERYRAL